MRASGSLNIFACSWVSFPPVGLSCQTLIWAFLLYLIIFHFVMFAFNVLEASYFLKRDRRGMDQEGRWGRTGRRGGRGNDNQDVFCGTMWWKVRTNSCTLSSDLHVFSAVWGHTHTCIQNTASKQSVGIERRLGSEEHLLFRQRTWVQFPAPISRSL